MVSLKVYDTTRMIRDWWLISQPAFVYSSIHLPCQRTLFQQSEPTTWHQKREVITVSDSSKGREWGTHSKSRLKNPLFSFRTNSRYMVNPLQSVFRVESQIKTGRIYVRRICVYWTLPYPIRCETDSIQFNYFDKFNGSFGVILYYQNSYWPLVCCTHCMLIVIFYPYLTRTYWRRDRLRQSLDILRSSSSPIRKWIKSNRAKHMNVNVGDYH